MASFLFAFFLPSTAAAQGISFEVRGGAAVPLGPMIENGVEAGDGAGLSIGGGLGLAVAPNLVLAGGFSRHAFRCEPRCGLDGSGFEAGVRYTLPTQLPIVPWVYAGGLFHQLHLRERDVDAQTVTFVSESSPGVQVGGGFAVALTRNVSVTPGFRYNRYRARTTEADEFGAIGAEREHQLEYVTVEVGLRLSP
ncbi:MAG: hypothetical protein H0U67_00915 [Gemmatimonadetes bacterium]|nr:hypothetical protein [Gemmatimonadota bacterium]